MLLTYPAGGPAALLPFLRRTGLQQQQQPSATLVRARWLIGTMVVTALVNLVYLGPETTRVMGVRKHQETRDGKKSYDAGPHSKAMEALNKQFGILHSLSTIVNLGGLGAMVWYAGLLGQGLRL